jgi:hypothetical protein
VLRISFPSLSTMRGCSRASRNCWDPSGSGCFRQSIAAW